MKPTNDGPTLARHQQHRWCYVCNKRTRLLGGKRRTMPGGFQAFVCGDCWQALTRKLWRLIAERKVKLDQD